MENTVFFVTKPGSAIVTVSHKGKILQQTEFRVKRIPDPFSTSNEDYKTYSGKISKDEILRWGTIEFLYKYLDLQLNAQMVFYRMLVFPAEGDGVVCMRRNITFDDIQLGLLKKLKPGDKLYFEDIIVIDELYNPRKVGAATIIIE